MRHLTALLVFLFYAILTTNSVLAGSDDDQPATISKLSIVGNETADKKEHFHFKLGSTLPIKASGPVVVEEIKQAWGKKQSIALYFDGVQIATLPPPPEKLDSENELRLNFDLIRDPSDLDSRQTWNTFFKKKKGYLMDVRPTVAIGTNLPIQVSSTLPFKFYVAPFDRIIWTLIVCSGALLLSYWYLAKKTKMLCIGTTNYYSLGKAQLAFWGILVAVSFVGIWFLTGNMQYITPQVIILLGLSGATGLSSEVIGNNKMSGIQNRITELQHEKHKLEQLQATAPSTFSQANKDRLAQLNVEIQEQSIKLSAPRTHQGFWQDICNDGDGPSFHRLQVVTWTLIMGIIFVQTVAQQISMPEFPETLLSLIGISNATYVGLKIPERA